MNRDFFPNPALQFPPWKSIPEDPICQPNWENPDRYSQFDHALFSATFPTTSAPGLKLPIMDQFVKESLPGVENSMSVNPNLPLLASDPGFAERAARFSCFGSRSFNGRDGQLGGEYSNSNSNRAEGLFVTGVSPVSGAGKFPRVSSSPALRMDRGHVGFEENRNSDESSVSEQVLSPEDGLKKKKDLVSRKRKGVSFNKSEEVIDELKKVKKSDEENGGKVDENTKPPEPVKDYIHVRARRGQATDSHSLAERVRREKISERMKLLQNLVPNCNKVTGKALMLDEIINYVQSLQRQVEFLSMKLATVNPSLDDATNNTISQNVGQPNEILSQSPFYQDHQELFNESVREFIQPFPNFEGFGQDDLQSIVRMGFNDNLDLDTSFFPMTHDQPSNMKTEL